MMIQFLGWICTALILIGYLLNAKQELQSAMIIWIIGDIGWVAYDIMIQNVSHAALSATIIGLNIYGIFNILNKNNSNK